MSLICAFDNLGTVISNTDNKNIKYGVFIAGGKLSKHHGKRREKAELTIDLTQLGFFLLLRSSTLKKIE
jgi:hypothetical protein